MANREDDSSFPPPDDPIEVICLHCGEKYRSDTMVFGPLRPDDDDPLEMWHCPTEGCDAGGFGLDIFPTDPSWQDPKGQLHMIADEGDADSELDDELHPRTVPRGINGFFHDDGTPMSAEEFFRADKAFDDSAPDDDGNPPA